MIKTKEKKKIKWEKDHQEKNDNKVIEETKIENFFFYCKCRKYWQNILKNTSRIEKKMYFKNHIYHSKVYC